MLILFILKKLKGKKLHATFVGGMFGTGIPVLLEFFLLKIKAYFYVFLCEKHIFPAPKCVVFRVYNTMAQ